MTNDADFSRLIDWIGRLNAGLEAAEAEGRSAHNLLQSAEYELTLLRRQLETVPPADDAPHATSEAAPAAPAGSAAASFNSKLRHPSRVWQRLWAA
jgi:hypothetical protein